MGIIVVVLLVGGYFLMSSTNVEEYSDNMNSEVSEVKSGGNELVVRDPQAKIILISGENFKFIMNGVDNPDIKVKEGEKIRVEFVSTKGFHDFVIDEFNVATEKVRDGGKTSVEFVADKNGTFEYYCSVGEHRANGMKGTFIVE